MKLTESWLRSQSTPGSFERGQGYYKKGHVVRIIAFDGFYRGEVQGTELYHQTLDFRGAYPNLTCTCPYSSGGYCKHLIAVGLGILDGKYESPTELEISRNTQAEIPDMEVVSHWWEEMPEGFKLQFLEEALRTFPSWRKPFVEYMDVRRVPALHIELDKLRDEMLAEILALPIRDTHLPPEPTEHEEAAEIDMWEAHETEQIQLIEAAFQQGIKHVHAYQREADWPNALVALQAMYEVSIRLPFSHPKHHAQYTEFIQSVFQDNYHRVVDRISESLLGPSTRRWMVSQLFDRIQQYSQQVNPIKPDSSPVYRWEDWRLLLQLLSATPALAQFLSRKLEAHQLEGPDLAPLKAFLIRILKE